MTHRPTRPRDRKETAKARKRPASRHLTRPEPVKRLAGCENWPIVRAYVPPDDCWKSTGYGSAGIVRQQPDGKLSSSFFSLGLMRGGLMSVFGHVDSSWDEIERDLRIKRHTVPPAVVGEVDLATRYIWGAYAWSLEDGLRWPDDLETQHLAVVPPLSGGRHRWLAQFAGPTGLVPGDLYDLVKSFHPMHDPTDKEPLVFTEIVYSLIEQAAVLEKLRSAGPHILPMDQDLDTVYFECTREFDAKKVMPLEPMRSRQPVGSIRIQGGKLLAESRALSLAAYMISKLREYCGDLILFERTSWSDLDAWLTAPEKTDPTSAY
jgi:hypothetical protein